MINGKSITLFACAWGDQIRPTSSVIDFCIQSFPYFDVCYFENRINNLIDYNKFMIEDLDSIIKTDFVMTVQSDGFIINPNLWQNKFLEYDYIGAPWPWHGVCGNGGFSLRSKKFLQTSSKLKYISYHEEYGICPEDNFMCLAKYNREFFLKEGVKFAEPNIAIQFSFEHPISSSHNQGPDSSFGFHGKHLIRTQ